MGISHDYHSTGRSRRGGPGGVIRFAGAVAGILLVSFAIAAILEHGQAQPEELPTVTANGTAQNILAPLPHAGRGGQHHRQRRQRRGKRSGAAW